MKRLIWLSIFLYMLPMQGWAGITTSVTIVSGGPTNILPGETTQLEITIANNNEDSAVTSLAFNSALPAGFPDGLKVNGPFTYECDDPSGPSTVNGSGTLTAPIDGQTINLSGGVIPARANNTDGICRIQIPVTAGTTTGNTATYQYQVADGAVTGTDNLGNVANSGNATQSINVLALAKPTISKSFSASIVRLGDNASTLTITLRNTNAIAIPGFNITDTFPTAGGNAIIQVAATPNVSTTCNNGGASPTLFPAVNAGDDSITATGIIPARTGNTDGQCTISVDIEAAQTNGAFSLNNQENRITDDGDFTNDLGIEAANDATANITVQSPLTVSKAFSSTVLSSGEAGSIVITLNNAANGPLTISSFTDSPIDGVVGTGVAGAIGSGLVVNTTSTTCAGGGAAVINSGDGVTLTGGTIPANGSCTLTINFTAAAQVTQQPVTYTNNLGAGDVGISSPTGIVSQARSASILVADELRVLKTASPSTAAPGNPIRYVITVQNFSASVRNNVTIDDTLPAGFTYLTGIQAGNDFNPSLSAGCGALTESSALGAANAAFTIATLPARASESSPGSCSVTFWAMVDPNAADGVSTVNTIDANDVCFNAGANCNGSGTSSTPNTQTEQTVFSATKRFNSTTNAVTLSEGTIAQLSVTLSNISANPLTNVSLSDTFPTDGVTSGQLQIATPANASTTCGGTITAVSGTTSLSLNGATVPARANNGTGATGSCVLNVDVIGPAGTYDNVAQLAGTETLADGVTTRGVAQFDTNTARLVYLSALAATKSFSPASVSSGGRSRVTVRLNNTGAVALTNVSVTDPLPAGMVLADPANAASTCAGNPVFTSATAGASTITLEGANIAGNGSCDVQFDVVATGNANWDNTIPAGNITADGGVINVSDVTGTLNNTPGSSVIVSKTTNPGTLTFPGETSQLTVTFTNGTDAVSNLTLTDFFTIDGTSGSALNGMAIAATASPLTDCPGGVINVTPGGTSVAISGVSLASNESCSVSVNVTSSAVGSINNTIPIGAVSTDQGLSNTGQAVTSLATQSNIGVVKQFTPEVVQPGERSRLRITFFNASGQALADIAVTDTLPAGVTIPSGPNPTITCSGGVVSTPTNDQVQISGGNLPAASGGVAQSCYAEIDVVVAAEGQYVNTIPQDGVTATSGGSPVTNAQPTSATLQARLPLEIHKAIENNTLDASNPVGFTTGTASALPGASATLTIRFDNNNAQALTATSVTDTLPMNLVIAQTPNASSTCANAFVSAPASATEIRLTGATIPANGNCTVTVDVLSNISGSYINTIPASAVSTAEGVTNGEPTSAELVVSMPPVVNKQFSPAVIPPGGVSTLTIVFENDNGADINLSSAFVDTLPTAPGNIVVASTPNIVKTCPGSVTAAAGSGSVTYANNAVIPDGGCTISVDVTGSTAGEHINNIPAGDLQTNVGNNQQPANASLLVSPLGFISGRVFEDNNVTPNGTFESGTDTPIPGVSIELRDGPTCGGALTNIAGVTNPVVTDGLGNYLFASLPAGTYSICEPVQPTGLFNGDTTAGSINAVNGSTGTAGTGSNPTATSSQITAITLNADGGAGEISGSTNNNFAEIAPSSISGVVFLDQNNNGIQNGADTPLANQPIELLNNLNQVVVTVNTDANGAYSFTDLEPGTYSVRQQVAQPADTTNGMTIAGTVGNGGTDGTATDVMTLPSAITGIILPPNTQANDNNFAEIPNSRRITGNVFLDYDNNGSINGPDHGISGQTINLTGTDINGNPVNLTTTTDNDGEYTFDGLPEGTYTITQPNQPVSTSNGTTTAGSTGGTATTVGVTPSAISAINLTGSNTVSGENNFAEQPDAAVDLAVSKSHSPASLGEGSSTGFYTISASNIGTVDSSGTITIVDTLPAGITAAAWPTSGDWVCSVSGQVVTCNTTQILAANGGVSSDIILRVAVANGLAGQILVNNVAISGGNEPPGFESNNSDSDPTTIAEPASVEGHVWFDSDHDRVFDGGETPVAGWNVDLLLNGINVATTTTDATGLYSFVGLSPGSGYEIQFKEPTSGSILGQPVTNEDGAAFTNGVVNPTTNPAGASNAAGTLDNLTLVAGVNTQEQSLPLDPSGVVYDSVSRTPVSGATVTLLNGGVSVDNSCLVGGNNNQVTGVLGLYQFLLINPAPGGCPGNGNYEIEITNYPGSYLPQPSTIIPVTAGPYTPIADVAPNIDAIQTQAGPPTGGQDTTHYFSINLTLGGVGVVNNHIPLDPVLGGAIAITKTTPKRDVVRGELVPYTITATNTLTATLSDIDLQDQIPAGFNYVDGSAVLNGVAIEPTITGRLLTWPNQTFTSGEVKTITLILIVGAGVGEGEYVNQAWAFNALANARVSAIATATVRVIPDPLFDCSDLIGKVFDDKNINGYQDEGEPGLAGVRVVTPRGLLITTDDYGRFHIACADVPNELHGSNFIMKLDERTLPSGYRVTTENPRVVRLTRGKLAKLNFGAGLHRMLRIEIDASAFDGEELTTVASQQLDEVVELLQQQPSQLRLSYNLSVGEEKAEAEQKTDNFAEVLTTRWQQCDCEHYALTIEKEVAMKGPIIRKSTVGEAQ